MSRTRWHYFEEYQLVAGLMSCERPVSFGELAVQCEMVPDAVGNALIHATKGGLVEIDSFTSEGVPALQITPAGRLAVRDFPGSDFHVEPPVGSEWERMEWEREAEELNMDPRELARMRKEQRRWSVA